VNAKWLLCLVGFFALQSHAQTLTYHSSSFLPDLYVDGFVRDCTSPDDTFYCVNFSFTLDAPLTANMVNQQVGGTLSNLTVGSNLAPMPIVPTYSSFDASFSFSTDSNKKIIGWNFYIIGLSGAYPYVAFIGSTQVDYGIDQNVNIVPSAGPGSWVQPSIPQTGYLVVECAGEKSIPPSNTIVSTVSPDTKTVQCKAPGTLPSSYYIKASNNNGASWKWVTLKALGLGLN